MSSGSKEKGMVGATNLKESFSSSIRPSHFEKGGVNTSAEENNVNLDRIVQTKEESEKRFTRGESDRPNGKSEAVSLSP